MKNPAKFFVSGASVLMLGAVSGQILLLAASPILTRLFSPEDFGGFGLFVSLFAFLNIVSTARYELAIPIAKKDQFALTVMSLTYLLLACFILMLLIVSKPFHAAISLLFDTEISNAFVFLLIASVFFSGAYRITSFWAFRQLAFRTVAFARLAQGFGLAVTQISFGFAGYNSAGLLLGHTAGFLISSLIALHLAFGSVVRSIHGISTKRIIAVAKRFRRFPIYSTWSDLMNTVGTQLPVLAILFFFSPNAAGLYFLAVRLANAPVAIIAEAVTKTVLATASKREMKPVLSEFSCRVFGALLRLGTVPMLCALPLGPLLFDFIFGSEWEPAGRYFAFLIPWSLAVFTVVPMLSLFHVAERQKEEFLAQLFIFLGRSVALFIGALSGSIELALILFSSVASATYIFAGAWALQSVGNSFDSVFKVLGQELILGLFAMMIVSSTLWFAPSEYGLIFGVAVSIPLAASAIFSGIRNFKRESAVFNQ